MNFYADISLSYLEHLWIAFPNIKLRDTKTFSLLELFCYFIFLKSPYFQYVTLHPAVNRKFSTWSKLIIKIPERCPPLSQATKDFSVFKAIADIIQVHFCCVKYARIRVFTNRFLEYFIEWFNIRTNSIVNLENNFRKFGIFFGQFLENQSLNCLKKAPVFFLFCFVFVFFDNVVSTRRILSSNWTNVVPKNPFRNLPK